MIGEAGKKGFEEVSRKKRNPAVDNFKTRDIGENAPAEGCVVTLMIPTHQLAVMAPDIQR